ncbi:MAG: protein-glutamate O-methyltransferase CheR [Elusimicrobiota bacterium]|nr:protein-glutamate O-methyltransferase CheR [Elusimicrobiota bacterium]
MTRDESGFAELLEKIRMDNNVDFSEYKANSIKRLLHKRMNAVKVENYADYGKILDNKNDEYKNLFNTIFINVSEFFRDREVFEMIEKQIFPEVMEKHKSDRFIKIWSAGCAAGEETYSVAILASEILDKQNPSYTARIYGTDIDRDAVDAARKGLYTFLKAKNCPEKFLKKYFRQTAGHYAVKNDLREIIRFGFHNLAAHPPIIKLDILLCRNVCIYFDKSLLDRVFKNFYSAINQGGFLILGKTETPYGETAASYKKIDFKKGIYQKKN